MREWTAEDVISELDTNRFGMTIAKVDDFSSCIDDDLDMLKRAGVELVISRIESSNIAIINRLEECGFRLKDTQLTFDYSLKNDDARNEQASYLPPESKESRVIIEQATLTDSDKVGDLAYDAFKGYGHYACNSRLNLEAANEIYRDWAKRSCVDKKVADHMFVAKVDSNVAGFLSLKVVQENGISLGIQHLGAVDSLYRNYGIFRMLIYRCLKEGIDNDHPLQRTFLQSVNIPVIRSYLKLGFKNSGSMHTLHAWL